MEASLKKKALGSFISSDFLSSNAAGIEYYRKD